jgi:hypothetical protein
MINGRKFRNFVRGFEIIDELPEIVAIGYNGVFRKALFKLQVLQESFYTSDHNNGF